MKFLASKKNLFYTCFCRRTTFFIKKINYSFDFYEKNVFSRPFPPPAILFGRLEPKLFRPIVNPLDLKFYFK